MRSTGTRYDTCHRKYSLVVPFIERFFNLAQPGTEEHRRRATSA